MGLVIAIAVANGSVFIYEARDVLNIASWTESFEIKTMSAGCNCISWNLAFDENPMIVVGCQKYEPSQQSILQKENQDLIDESLLQIYQRRDSAKENAFIPFFKFKGGHTDTINDVAWAPIAGRSFHIIVSCSKDKSIIVWKIVTKLLVGPGEFKDSPDVE